MTIANAETFLTNARQQTSQRDINQSLLNALSELTKQMKQLEDDVRRVRRDVQMSRRF